MAKLINLPPFTYTPSALAEMRVVTLVNLGSTLTTESPVADIAREVVRALKLVWEPTGEVTTELLLATMGTHAKALFDAHGELLNNLWIDEAKRAIFLQACTDQELAVSIIEGAPVFARMKPYTTNEDGRITLT